MNDYYSARLSAQRLRRVYEVATPAVRAYLAAEIRHVASRIRPGFRVLELGCGFGRVLRELAGPAVRLLGIDTSQASLALAREYLAGISRVSLARMDAIRPGLQRGIFDLVCCVQNGISAFHVDQRQLVATALDLAKPGGLAMLSSYAAELWADRLEWFRIQATEGLIGPIDEVATGNGRIVCTDGFTATTVTPENFAVLASGLDCDVSIVTVAGSSVFCELHRRSA